MSDPRDRTESEPRDAGEEIPRAGTERAPLDRRHRVRRDRRAQSVVIVVAVVAGLVAALQGSRPDQQARALGHPTPTTVAPKPAGAKTVLFGHVGANHRLDLLAVAGVGAGGKVGSVIFVPTTTLVQVPSFDTQPLLDVPRLGKSSLLATTVENALGIHFNQVIVIGNSRLTRLLATAGHLNVTFRRAVQVDDAAGTLAYSRGRAKITAADATRLLIGPDTAGTLEHLVTVQAVLEGWFDRLRRPWVASQTVRGASPALALVALAKSDVGFDTLPVDVLSSGSVARYELRQPDADELVRSDLPYALLTSGKRPRVELLNGTGAVALTQTVARRIVPAGGEITLTGNVPGFGVRRTSVVYYRAADLPAAKRLVTALGVGSVALGNVPIDVVDLTVVVGADFHPNRS